MLIFVTIYTIKDIIFCVKRGDDVGGKGNYGGTACGGGNHDDDDVDGDS